METIQIGNNVRWFVAPEVAEAAPGSESSFPVSKPKRKARPRKAVSQAKIIFAIAEMHGYENVRKVGEGGLIDQPIETNNWLVTRKELYRGIIPPEGLQQAENLTKGIPIKGFVVADDKRRIEQLSPKRTWTAPSISPDWGKIATGAGKVAAAIAVGGAIISFFPLVLGIGVIGAALAYDPLLIAVTAEDEWICLYEWWH